MYLREIGLVVERLDLTKAFKGQMYPAILDGGQGASGLGRYSIGAVAPYKVVSAKDGIITDGEGSFEGDPFEYLEGLIAAHSFADEMQTLVAEGIIPEDYPSLGGAIGYFGYDLRHHVERLSKRTVDDVGLPDMRMAFYDGFIIVDHREKKIRVSDLGIHSGHEERMDHLESLLKTAMEADGANEADNASLDVAADHDKFVAFDVNMDKERYLQSIGRIKDYIRSGDIYQVNMTQRFTVECDKEPMELFHRLTHTNPAPFGTYLGYDDFQVLSSSPERFIRIRNGEIETRPIKGTRPRSNDPVVDAENRVALENSAKDRSELLMIVDLERNDLGRSAEVGTVHVPELFVIETYPTVYHLVSTVKAKLRDDISPVACIKAAFPGGSITGAPKIRAMEVIDELEPTTRGLYTGSIGYLGFDGQVDLNIVIRTIVLKDKKAYFQTGGGIVWDSDAEMEYMETFHKAKALMRVLDVDTSFITDRL